MVMEKTSLLKKLVAVLVVIIMLVPIFYEVIIGSTLKKIKYEDLEDTEAASSSYQGYGFEMVYVAPSSNDATSDNRKEIKAVSEEIIGHASGEPISVHYLDYDKLSSDEKEEIFGDSNKKTAYIFYVNGEMLTTVYGEIPIENLKYFMSTYSAENVSPNLTNYKVVKDSSEFKKLIKRKNEVTMAVLGSDNCYYCNEFKTIYNQVAGEYDVDIYYFDETSYDTDEFEKIKASGLIVPKACTGKEDEDLKDYKYGTPLTLFIKNGKVIDCLDGYTGKSSLITKLKTVGMIKEDEE